MSTQHGRKSAARDASASKKAVAADPAGVTAGAGKVDDSAATSRPPVQHVGPAALALSLFLYTFARLVLVVLVGVIIVLIGRAAGVQVPMVVAAVFGVLIALPMGMIMFKPLRLRVNRQIAAVEEERRRRHEDLQSRLRGEQSK